MLKLVFYISNLILFLVLNVFANGAQLQNNSSNQLLSSIYADYKNDFITWKSLPKYPNFLEKDDSLINQIITGEDHEINKIQPKSIFALDLIKSLEQIKKGECKSIDNDNSYYLFEDSLIKSFNFWVSYCQNKINLKILDTIDKRFKNIAIINKLYLYFNEDNFNEIKNLHKIITQDSIFQSDINSKELVLIKNIFESKQLVFPVEDSLKFEDSLNSLTFNLDKNFKVDNYIDILHMQVYQTSIYYFYAKEYKKSLVLLSYLIKNDLKNKDYYLYKKTSFMAELNPNIEILKSIENLNFKNINFHFFKDYLFLSTATNFDYNIHKLIEYYYNITTNNEWQKIELAMIIAIELYSHNNNIDALKFINECCLEYIKISNDPIHLFKYGILLERNGEIKKSETVIQKSIDISEGSYPYILNYLAYIWVDNNRNLKKAEKMLLQAVNDSEYQDGAILDSLGWLYFRKNEIEQAEKWILKAYKMEPSEPEIIDHLSQIYSIQGRDKEAKFLDNKILLFHKDYFKFNEVLERN
tara:strand:- start:485 stop:2065 length:1581 start_codon:yes stop_codon:yes gene_type:complete